MEKFKTIKGTNDLYLIGNFGTVLRNNSEIVSECTEVKLAKNHNGYLTARLSVNGKKQYHRAHRLVAGAFLSNLWNKPEVNHKDCCKTNNHYTNLEWCTREENREHAKANGKLRGGQGRKLSKKEIKEIKSLYMDKAKTKNKYGKFKDGETYKTIAKKYEVSEKTIVDVVKTRSYLWF